MKKLFILVLIGFISLSTFSQTKILPFGESTTMAIPGYRKILCDLAKAEGLSIDMIGPNFDGVGLSYDSDNAGFTGSTFSDLRIWLDSAYMNYSPDIVILWVGTNDCGWGYQFYDDNQSIIDELSNLVNEISIKYPNTLIFVSSIPPMSNSAYTEFQTPVGKASENAEKLNDAIPGMIDTKRDAGKKVYFIDTRPLLKLSADISNDGIHPNKQGYEKIGVLFYTAIHPYLTSLLGNESDISVYPNPVNNYQLTIKLNISVTERITLSVYNLIGNRLYSANQNSSSEISVSLPQSLDAGSYILKIDSGIYRIAKYIIIEK